MDIEQFIKYIGGDEVKNYSFFNTILEALIYKLISQYQITENLKECVKIAFSKN